MNLTEEQVNKIEINKSYNSWRAVCECLGIKASGSGKGQGYQRLDVGRYFEFTKEGKKYVFLSKKEIPSVKMNTTNSPYRKLVQLLMLDLLADKDFKVTITKDNLYFLLNMVNQDWKKYRERRNVLSLSDDVNINSKTIDVFYNRHSSNFKSIIESALNDLKRKLVIEWKDVVMVATSDYKFSVATDIEVSRMIECKNEIMHKELGYSDLQEVYINGDYPLLMEMSVGLYNRRFQDDTTILFFYNVYDIIYTNNRQQIDDEKHKLYNTLENDYKINLRNDLNNIILDNISKNVINRTAEKYYLDSEIKLANILIKAK